MKTNRREEPIRNLTGFMKSYMGSDSFKKALTRQAPTIECSEEDSKGRIVKFRKTLGVGNQLAIALKEAFS